ncbi:MAG: hypothetical protein KatS3mg105_3719 [Gemmatales bacterium]|nr:MAG: hypothetical protein KatS3mg105_3719 [Gemmatales bacterium]
MNNSVRWFGLIVNTVLVTSASAGDWMQFRGPGGLGISDEKSPPLTWSEKENLRWKVALPGRGVASPVIAKGRVYVTACTDYQQNALARPLFRCQDRQKTLGNAKSGRPAAPNAIALPTWRHRPPSRTVTMSTPFSQAGTSSPSTKKDICSGIARFPKTTPLSAIILAWPPRPSFTKTCSFFISKNAGESFGLGVDKMTGENLWKTPRHRDINWVSPIIIEQHGRPEVLLQGRTDISAYDPITGKKYWTYKAGLASAPSPVAGMGLIFCPGGGVQAIRVPPRQKRSRTRLAIEQTGQRLFVADLLPWQSVCDQ